MMENQRVRLSKKMLKDSLLRLMNEKSIHRITVKEICGEAQINRTTFYKYYGSQYDLLKEMENDVLAQIDGCLDTGADSQESNLLRLVKIAGFINENIEFCRILLNNNVDPEFPQRLINLPRVRQYITQLAGEYSEDKLDYIFSFIVDGGFSVFKKWIGKENRESPEEISSLLNNTIMKIFLAEE